MKFYVKLALTLCLLSLCLAITGVTAQSNVANISSVSSPVTSNLNAVCIVNNATNDNNDITKLDAWAVGDGGNIIRWNGNSWTKVSSPTSTNLYSVVFTNATSGWAVGGSGDNGIILNYNNGNWSQWKKVSNGMDQNAEDPIKATLYGVTMSTDGSQGWAVGSNGTALGWNGLAWFNLPTNVTATLRSVAMAHGSSTTWAVGDDGTIIKWDGANWTKATSPTTASLYGIAMVDSNTAWAVGGNSSTGIILKLNTQTWSLWNKINIGTTANQTNTIKDSVNATIYSLSFDNATSAWAVGAKGTVLYWTGTEWDCFANVGGGVNLKGVAMVHGENNGSTQAWAVGDGGKILAWTGLNWVPEFPMFAVPLLFGVGLFAVLLKKGRLQRKITI